MKIEKVEKHLKVESLGSRSSIRNKVPYIKVNPIRSTILYSDLKLEPHTTDNFPLNVCFYEE
jgi:hypothetical protein